MKNLLLRINGGGDSEEEASKPFAGFTNPEKRDREYIKKCVRNADTPEAGRWLYNFTEDVMTGILDPNRSRRSRNITRCF